MNKFLLLFSQIIQFVYSEDIVNSTCGNRCCQNFYKDEYTRSCLECPLGTHGLNCSGICPLQYYGRLCGTKCDCPLHLCDRKYGCIRFQTIDGDDNIWKYIAFTLIGSISIMFVVGLMMLMKSGFANRCKEKIDQPNKSQTGNFINEKQYEERRSSSSPEETGAVHLYNICSENNYADMRTTVTSPIYDNPEDFETNLHQALVKAINTVAASK